MPQPRPKKPKIITDDPRSHARASPEHQARIVVHRADQLTKRQAREIAGWLQDQAQLILENVGELAATYRATLY